jgi:hypothetical protein
MKNCLLLFTFIVVLSACSSKKTAQVKDGLYFISDSISGFYIKEYKTFDYSERTFIDTGCITPVTALQMALHYDSLMYADTFAVIDCTIPDVKTLHTLIERISKREEEASRIGLVIDNTLIKWEVPAEPFNSIRFKLCYCDYTKEELKKVESLVNAARSKE